MIKMHEPEYIRDQFLNWPEEKQNNFFKWVQKLKGNYRILEEENKELKKAMTTVGGMHE